MSLVSIFFFSSRRRHTRWPRDWSSDVCSSDLIMTTEFVALYKNQTVQEAMRELKTVAPDAETIYYLYVLDDNKRLAGVLSLRDLIIAAEDVIIETVMSEKVVSVSVAQDQEEIAPLMRAYDFLAVPIVDFQHRLLGI